jgi:hypothetical protein
VTNPLSIGLEASNADLLDHVFIVLTGDFTNKFLSSGTNERTRQHADSISTRSWGEYLAARVLYLQNTMTMMMNAMSTSLRAAGVIAAVTL